MKIKQAFKRKKVLQVLTYDMHDVTVWCRNCGRELLRSEIKTTKTEWVDRKHTARAKIKVSARCEFCKAKEKFKLKIKGDENE